MSNLDRYTYDNYINQTRSEKIILCHLEPKHRLLTWSLHAGSIYKRLVDHWVLSVYEDSVELTKVSSIAGIDDVGKWFFDDTDKYLYVRSSDSLNPLIHFTYAIYRLFFSNAPIALPFDMNTGREVEYEPLITSTNKFKAQLDDENVGTSIEAEGRISLQNNDRGFDNIYDKYIWENTRCQIWSFARKMKAENAQLLFSGKIFDKAYKATVVEFKIRDFVNALRESLNLPLFDVIDGDIIDDVLGTPKRRIYGRVTGLKTQSLDMINENFLLSGKFEADSGAIRIDGNNDTDLLLELTPEDQVTIGTTVYKVKTVEQKYFTLVDPIVSAITDTTIKCLPILPFRGRNRNHLISHHALRQPTTTISFVVNYNRFDIVDVVDIGAGDVLEINGESKEVRRITQNRITLVTDLSVLPVVGDTVIKRPVFSAYHGKNLISRLDYLIENLSTGAKIIFNIEAERNMVGELPMSGLMTFTIGSRVVTTARIDLSGQTKFTNNNVNVVGSSTDITGALIFTKNSKTVSAGSKTITGELSFINGSTIVATKKNDIDNDIIFKENSATVKSKILDVSGQVNVTNSSTLIDASETAITGQVAFINGSVKVTTRLKPFDGNIEFILGSNIVSQKTEDISGKIQFTNGSINLRGFYEVWPCTIVSFVKDSNFLIGTNCLFQDRTSAGQYIRPYGTRKNYKIANIVNQDRLELIGNFEESSINTNQYEIFDSGDITKFTSDISSGKLIRVKDASTWYKVQNVVDDEELNLTTIFSETTIASDAEKTEETSFLSQVSAGDYIKTEDMDEFIEVDVALDDKHIRLKSNFTGSDQSGQGQLTMPTWLTAFKTELSNGHYLKCLGNSYDSFYKIGNVKNNFEITLSSTFQEASIGSTASTSSSKTQFISELSAGNFVKVEGEAWYQILSIDNNAKLTLVANYTGTTKQTSIQSAIKEPRFITQINNNDWVRPIGNFSWYQVKKVIDNETLKLWNKFAEAKTSAGMVTSTPTFFLTDTTDGKVIPGEFIKPDIGVSFFEVASVQNDYQLTLVGNFTEGSQSGASQKSTDPTQFLAEINVDDWIKPNYPGGKYHQVASITNNTSLLLKSNYSEDTTAIVTGVVTTDPTAFIEEISAGDFIQPKTGTDWVEVKTVIDDSRLELINPYLKLTTTELAVRQTPGQFLSQLKNRDWIRPNNDINFYEILHIISDTRLLLREQFRASSRTRAALRKSVNIISDSSIITVETLGKTKNNLSTGVLIKTCADVIEDILKELGFANDINSTSFQEASEDATALVSLALPLEIGGDIPSAKTVIDLMTKTAFGSIYNDNNFKINMSVLSAKTPTSLTSINDYDVINYQIATKSLKIINKCIVRYRQRDFNLSGGSSPYSYVTHISSFVTNFNTTNKTRTVNVYLWNYSDAETWAQRYIFYNELAKSLLRIQSSLQLTGLNLNDPVMIDFNRMYLRFGSNTSKLKIGLVSAISKNGLTTEIVLDDIANLFNRAATITKNTAKVFSGATDKEKIFNGYITDTNGLIDNNELTANTNLIS